MHLFDSIFQLKTAQVILQSQCQSKAHAAALNMKKLAHMHTVHTEAHMYLIGCFRDHCKHKITVGAL